MQPFESLVPADLLQLSGAVFYSGRDAFTGSSPIYFLGLNPGGDRGFAAGRLAMFKLGMGDRWFDDVIQNMRVMP